MMGRMAWMVCAGLLLAACAAGPVTAPSPDGGDDEGLQHARRAVVALVVERGDLGDAYGAGVVYDDRGHILTAHHVIDGSTRVLALLEGGVTLRAQIVAEAPIYDLAMLKTDVFLAGLMRPAKASKREPRIGETVWSVGNPFGTARFGGASSVGRGVVSAVGRSYMNEETGRLYLQSLQHDAPTNPGNSGGGVFSTDGELLGINALITTTRDKAGDGGVVFALPVSVIEKAAGQMLQGRRVTHGWLGVTHYRQATEVYPQGFGRLRAVLGPLTRGGPAEIAGARAGDIVMRIEDAEVHGANEVLALEDALTPGRNARLTVNRDGREINLTVRVGERPWPPR